VFRFFLINESGGELDPAAFVTAVPNWSGETFSLGSGQTFRILEIRTNMPEAVLDAGFHSALVLASL
jgi:hypothetical protein